MARSYASAASSLTTGSATVFTVPSGEKYVVTHVRIQASSLATVATMNANGGVFGSGQNMAIAPLAAAGSAGSSVDYYGATVFSATDTLTCQLSASTGSIIVDYQRIILG